MDRFAYRCGGSAGIQPASRFTRQAGFAAFIWRLILTTGTGSIFGFIVARQAFDAAIYAPMFIIMSFSFGLAIFILTLLAMVFEKQARTDEALTVLERALTLAHPGGLVFPFLELGTPMTALLSQLPRGTTSGPFIEQIMATAAPVGSSAGTGQRSLGWRITTSVMLLCSMCGSMPRRVVSTSGNSGMVTSQLMR